MAARRFSLRRRTSKTTKTIKAKRDESRTSACKEKKAFLDDRPILSSFSYCTTNDPRAYSTQVRSQPHLASSTFVLSRSSLSQFPPRYTSSPCICFPDHSWLLRFRPLPLSSHNLSLSVSPLPDLLRKPRRKQQRRLSNA